MTASSATTTGPIRVLTIEGLQVLADLTASEASVVGHHWNAIRAYLDYGDDSRLDQFINVLVQGFELESRSDVIEWHAVRGDVSFESIYNEVV